MKVTEVFKTIFARFGNIKAGKFTDDETGEDLNDVARVLSKFNIQLYNAQGNMNDVGDILNTLAGQWEDLTTVEKNALATTIAGTRQRENFIVLMDNYKNAVEYTTEAMNSAGTAMEKYDAHLQSIEAAQAKLKATFEEFSQALIDSGIIKGFYDMASGGVEFLTMLIKIKPLIITIGTLIATKLVTNGFSKLKNLKISHTLTNIVDGLDLMRLGLIDDAAALKKNVHSLKDLKVGLQNGTINMKNFKAATDAAATTATKFQLILAAITLVVSIASSVIIKQNQEQQRQLEETAEKATEARIEAEKQHETVRDLAKEYEKLQNKTILDATDQARIVEIEKELNEQIDNINQKIEESNDKELQKLETLNLQNDEYAKQKNILNQLDATTAKILANETLSEKIAQRTKVEAQVGGKPALSYIGVAPDKIAEQILEQAFGQATDSNSDYNPTMSFVFSTNADTIVEQLQALEDARHHYLSTYTEEELMNHKIYNSINSTINKYKELINAYETAALKYWQADVNQIIFEDLKSTDYIEGEKYKIVDSTEAMEAYIKQLQKEAKEKNDGVEISEAYAQAIRDAVENAFPQFVQGSQNALKATTELISQLESYIDVYNTLNSIIKEYNSNGNLSYETWEKLLKLDDEYLSVLIDENGQIKANNQALEDLIKTRIEDATLTRVETYVNNLLTAAQNGTLNATLKLTNETDWNTNARLQNVMAIIASNSALAANKEQILKVISAMLKMSDSISINGNSASKAQKATEDWEKVLSYVNETLDDQIEKLEQDREAIEKNIEEQIKAKEKEIELLEAEKEALQDKNEEKNKEIELEELQRNLQKAQQRTMRVYYEDKGWVWEQDPEALQKAQQDLDDFYTEQEIDNIDKKIEKLEEEAEALEKTKDSDEDSYNADLKSIDDQIENLERYKDEWNKVKEDYEYQQNAIVAQAKLGAEAESEILNGRLGALDTFKSGYTQALSTLATETEKSAKKINTALGSFDFEKLLAMFGLASPSGYVGETGKLVALAGTSNGGTPKKYTGETSGLEYVYDTASKQYFLSSAVQTKEINGKTVYTIAGGSAYYTKPYASGTKSARAGLANVDELGNELIVPKQGRYRMMEYGDTVVPHNLSQRLFEVASNPIQFIANALNSVKSPILSSNSLQNSSSIINIGTIELPSVTNGDNFIKQLQIIAANR